MDDATSALIADLSGTAQRSARHARELLVKLGEPAVPPLVDALRAPDPRVRWEAAKALAQIASPANAHSHAAAKALVDALLDEEPGVRWLAAEGLIFLGRASLDPLLHALLQSSDKVWLREGAHHVLRVIGRGELAAAIEPVIKALEGIVPAIAVLPAARDALAAI
ncbi:MAG: HEAT repeat domain-containing protein [Tepidiformaceae bacterium]